MEVKKQWINNNRKKLKNTRIAVGIGGLFDYLAEEVPNPPAWVSNVGLEWLYRLITQPERWQRIFSATFIFLNGIFWWKFNMSFIYRENVLGLIQNKKGQILLVSPAWSNTIKWQFPQGGVDDGEEPQDAIIREMSEEIGTDQLKIIKHHPSAYRYKWPKWYRLFRGQRGQKQDIFILKFIGSDKDIKLQKEELNAWQWCEKDKVIEELYASRKEIGKIALKLLD